METIYYWLGAVVFWGLAVAALVVAWRFRPRNAFTRYIADLWYWFSVWFLGKRYHLPLEGARLLLSVDRGHKWPAWKRDVMAFMIRDSKRKGWKEPY